MSRKITFPVVSEGVRENSETGVRIVRVAAGRHEISMPSRFRVGGHQLAAETGTLVKAREIAGAVALGVRAAITKAHAEALIEDPQHVCDCDDRKGVIEGGHAVACRRREQLDLGQPTVEQAHAEALHEHVAVSEAYSVLADAASEPVMTPRLRAYAGALAATRTSPRSRIAEQHRAALARLLAAAQREDFDRDEIRRVLSYAGSRSARSSAFALRAYYVALRRSYSLPDGRISMHRAAIEALHAEALKPAAVVAPQLHPDR